MCVVVSNANQKGGVGKTVTSVNEAFELARLGHRVLVIDMDGQCNSTKLLTGHDRHEFGIYDVMTSESKNFDISSCVVGSDDCWGDVYVIPSSKNMHHISNVLSERFSRESILKNRIYQLRDHFDFIIIDLPPALNLSTVNALVASDYYTLLSKTCSMSEDGFDAIFDLADALRDLNPSLKFAGVVVNMIQKSNSPIVRDFMSNIKDRYGDRPLTCSISHSINVEKSVSKMMPVYSVSNDKTFARKYRYLSEKICTL